MNGYNPAGRWPRIQCGAEETIDDREQELKNTAERFADSMGQQFDIDFDMSVESLVRLDGWLAQWIDMNDAYSSGNPEEVVPVALGITAYVGEVLRRNLDGATWVTEQEEGQLPPPHVRLENGARINLMQKSIQVLTGADSPSFTEYFHTIASIARGKSPGDPS